MKNLIAFNQSFPFLKLTISTTMLLLVFMVAMNYYFPEKSANGFKSFIVAFEFAQTPQDISQLFIGLSTDEIKNIDKGNYFDFAYMLCYSFLLAYMFVKSAKLFHKKWLYIGIPLSIVILLGDFFENIILLKITGMYLSGINEATLSSLLDKLHVITWIKWGGLAFAFFIFYEVLYRLNWFYKVLGLICLFPFLYILASGEFTPKEVTIFTFSIFVAFFVLIIFGLSYNAKKNNVSKDM